MIRPTLLIAVSLIPFSLIANAQDLQRAPISSQEYIQSVSPLSGGGSVMSRSAPGQGVQTVTTIAQLPSVSNRTPSVGYQARPTYVGQWNGVAGQPVPANNGYVYPTPTGSTGFFAQRPTNTLGLEPLGSRAFQQTRFFQSTPAPQIAQNCPTCVGGTSTNYPVPQSTPFQAFSPAQAPLGAPPAALMPPTLAAPQPLPALNPPSWDGNAGMQYNLAPTWNSTLTPASPRSNYTPIFALRNLPPGTYLGQGSLGQPKAYIDGEPIRNLLRYFSY